MRPDRLDLIGSSSLPLDYIVASPISGFQSNLYGALQYRKTRSPGWFQRSGRDFSIKMWSKLNTTSVLRLTVVIDTDICQTMVLYPTLLRFVLYRMRLTNDIMRGLFLQNLSMYRLRWASVFLLIRHVCRSCGQMPHFRPLQSYGEAACSFAIILGLQDASVPLWLTVSTV